MKVLVLFDSIFPYSQGGRETGLFHLAKHAYQLGLGRIDFITMSVSASSQSRFPDIRRYSTLHTISGFQKLAKISGYNFFARLFDRLLFARRAETLGQYVCKGESYDCIISTHAGPTGMAAIRLARSIGAQSVINLRSHFSRELEITEPVFRPLLCRYREIEKYVLREADLVLTNGDDTYELCVNAFRRSRPTQVVYNGVDIERFTGLPRERRPETILVSNNPLREIKGPQDAIVAFAMLPERIRLNARLRLMGGRVTDQYKKLAVARGVSAKVEFLGEVSHFDMPQHLQNADIALHPILFSVGTTHASLETLAAGMPLVAYDAASLRRICVEDKNGRLLGLGDIGGFSRAMAELIENPPTRDRMGRASREMAGEFSWPKYAKRVFTAIAQNIHDKKCK